MKNFFSYNNAGLVLTCILKTITAWVLIFLASASLVSAQIVTDFDGDTRGDFVFASKAWNKNIILTAYASLKKLNPIEIYNSSNTSLNFSYSRFLVGNFDSDRITDYAIVYRYNKSSFGIFTLSSEKEFKPKRVIYSNIFSPDKSTFLAGNFDSDSLTDFAGIYDYGNTRIGVFLFLSEKNYRAKRVYLGEKKSWNFKRSVFVSGDFNGDGVDEIGALYSYLNNSLALFIFRPDKSYKPIRYYLSPANYWNFTKARFIVGDFDNDNKDEFLAAVENHKKKLSIYVFYKKYKYVPRFVSASSFNWSIQNSSFTINDFNLDNKEELGAFLKTKQGFYKLYNFSYSDLNPIYLKTISLDSALSVMLSPGIEAQPLKPTRNDFSIPRKINLSNLLPGDIKLILIKGARASKGQTISIFGKDGKLIHSTPCSTGRNDATPLGTYWAIYKREVLISRNFLVYCIKPVYFKKSYAIHGWPRSRQTHCLVNYFLLGRPASHGCVRVPEPMAIGIWKGSKEFWTKVKILP